MAWGISSLVYFGCCCWSDDFCLVGFTIVVTDSRISDGCSDFDGFLGPRCGRSHGGWIGDLTVAPTLMVFWDSTAEGATDGRSEVEGAGKAKASLMAKVALTVMASEMASEEEPLKIDEEWHP